MRKLLLFLVMLTINIVSFAQNSEPEKAKPMTDTEIVRKCRGCHLNCVKSNTIKV